MDTYLDKMKNFSPADTMLTGENMGEKRIQLVSDLPIQTALDDNKALTIEVETNINDEAQPRYLMGGSKIGVKRYWLKK